MALLIPLFDAAAVRPGTGARRPGQYVDGSVLTARRRRINLSARASTAAPPIMLLYALTSADGDPAQALAAGQGLADSQGWRTSRRIVDTGTCARPANRPGWARVRDAVINGRAHGVVAISWHHITPDQQLYLDELSWFSCRRAAVHLVHPETEQ
ncbi:hypothetical protein [Streptomyces sp. NPDC001404]|uniref:hypothetical protein n=1 Tax=Streptomyces sp. NPDC001404 TaxID=3364571 RepID=UPI003694D9D6